MLKDKVKEISKGEGNNKKKIENMIFLIVILVVTIIVINFILKGENSSQNDENTTSTYKVFADVQDISEADSSDMQKQLEGILKTIKGVGKVNVFISYSESSKTIAMYDEKTTTSSTEETDSNRWTEEYHIY